MRDSSYVQLRSFDRNVLQELKGKRDFQYNRYKEPPLSLWEKFWNWVWWKISQLLRTKEGRMTVWSILIILALAIVVYFVVKVTGMDQNGLFGRSNKGLENLSITQDNIHLISFENEIERAVNNGNYRLAIRLQYLQALKNLSDKRHIEWRINKTNTDYVIETNGKPFNNVFATLTSNFEYAWYGEKKVSKEQFLELQNEFQQFYKQV